MKMQIALADDIPADLTRLQTDIMQYFASHNLASPDIRCFQNGEDLYAHFTPGIWQVVFLDIFMKEMNGIELARLLRREDPDLKIIFISTSRDYAFDAFPLHPFDYLIKPYTMEAFRHVMNELLRSYTTPEPEINIRASRSSFQIRYRDIVSVLSQGHSLQIYVIGNPPIRSIMTFSEVYNELSSDPRFLLCNRGVLINMDHALTLENSILRMQEGPPCPLRVRDQAKLIAQFSQYQLSRMKKSKI